MIEDGIKRTKRDAERTASHFVATFSTPSGQEVLKYLKSISTNRVMPNSGTSEALWHLEGQRHTVMLIDQWINSHKPEGEN